MSTITDHYPETLLILHDQLVETLEESSARIGQPLPSANVPLHLTEHIRRHWGGRLLTLAWWGPAAKGTGSAGACPPPDQHTAPLPQVSAQTDTLRTARGRELRAVAWYLLAAAGTPHSCRLADDLAARVEQEWSTQHIYVPKGEQVDRAIRDAQVWAQFSGLATIDRVIQQHGLSMDRIYRITRRLQADKDAREQPTLF